MEKDSRTFLIPIDAGLSSSIRSSKSRIASLSSFLGHESNPRRTSWRKWTKSYYKTFNPWELNKSGKTDSDGTPKRAKELSADVAHPTLVSTVRGAGKNLVFPHESSRREYIRQNHENKMSKEELEVDKKALKRSDKSIEKSRHLGSGDNKDNNDDADDHDDKNQERIKTVGPSKFIQRKSKATTHETNDTIITSLQDDNSRHQNITQGPIGRRVVHIKNFSSFVGLRSVIAQINGGPLEKIIILDDPIPIKNNQIVAGQLRKSILEIWFLRSDDAESFMRFSLSGMFIINGFHYEPQWAPPDHKSEKQNTYHTSPGLSILQDMNEHGARRCLVLKKHVTKRVKSSSRHYPSPKSHLSDINILEINQDFGAFGDILDVTPVISRKLCVAIHFFNIEAAILAKRSFEDETSNFHAKYKEWTLWYGKDPADKPCINI